MVAGRDELVGMRIGMLQETPETDFKPVCLNGRQILNYMLAVEMLSKRKGEFLGSDKPEILKARKTKASLLELYKKMSRGDYDDASITSSSSGASGGPRPLITRSETRLDHQKTQGNAFQNRTLLLRTSAPRVSALRASLGAVFQRLRKPPVFMPRGAEWARLFSDQFGRNARFHFLALDGPSQHGRTLDDFRTSSTGPRRPDKCFARMFSSRTSRTQKRIAFYFLLVTIDAAC